jgi:PTS system nitrogen regulatory IIA component|tara:strand:- start:21876 stop:22337 length:462 start_codon:yes stop_codon:yes gene_type:complete
MQLQVLLSPARTLFGAAGSSKKRVIESAANFLAAQNKSLNADKLFRNIIEREQLGSTAIGEGMAIPHCRMKNCSRALGALIKLDNPVDFEAIDQQPVDILFVLLVPEEEHDQHLKILAEIAGLFSKAEFRDEIRASANSQEMYDIALKHAQEI